MSNECCLSANIDLLLSSKFGFCLAEQSPLCAKGCCKTRRRTVCDAAAPINKAAKIVLGRRCTEYCSLIDFTLAVSFMAHSVNLACLCFVRDKTGKTRDKKRRTCLCHLPERGVCVLQLAKHGTIVVFCPSAFAWADCCVRDRQKRIPAESPLDPSGWIFSLDVAGIKTQRHPQMHFLETSRPGCFFSSSCLLKMSSAFLLSPFHSEQERSPPRQRRMTQFLIFLETQEKTQEGGTALGQELKVDRSRSARRIPACACESYTSARKQDEAPEANKDEDREAREENHPNNRTETKPLASLCLQAMRIAAYTTHAVVAADDFFSMVPSWISRSAIYPIHRGERCESSADKQAKSTHDTLDTLVESESSMRQLRSMSAL